MNAYKNNRGQALAETIVVMAVLVPVLFWAATLFELQSVDRKATLTARLASWHNTLYLEDTTGSGEGLDVASFQAKVDNNVANALFDENGVKDTLCSLNECGADGVDFGAHLNARDAGKPLEDPDLDGATIENDNDDGVIDFSSGIAYRDRALVSPTLNYPSSHTSLISGMAGLQSSDIGGMDISIPINPKLSILAIVDTDPPCDEKHPSDPCGNYVESYWNQDPGSLFWPKDEVAGTNRYHVKATAALITNGFRPQGEASFQEDVGQIASDGAPMTVFEVFRGPLKALGLQEMAATTGTDGLNTTPTNQSRILPPQLGTFKD